MAAEGAKVVVNDLGGGPDGSGSDAAPAQQVAAEIRAMGGRAVASSDDITSAAGAEKLVQQAVDEFGALHVLVNNAGILRDRTIVNMTDAEWDDVIRVQLRGHFMPLRGGQVLARPVQGGRCPAAVSNQHDFDPRPVEQSRAVQLRHG